MFTHIKPSFCFFLVSCGLTAAIYSLTHQGWIFSKMNAKFLTIKLFWVKLNFLQNQKCPKSRNQILALLVFCIKGTEMAFPNLQRYPQKLSLIKYDLDIHMFLFIWIVLFSYLWFPCKSNCNFLLVRNNGVFTELNPFSNRKRRYLPHFWLVSCFKGTGHCNLCMKSDLRLHSQSL